MKYLNTKTQAVIETACVIRGGDWIEVQTNQPKKSTENQSQKSTGKKSGEQE